MRSSSPTGNRSEIEVVEGLRLGKRTHWAFCQSTYSVESCVSQKTRSAASVLKSGTGFNGFLIAQSLLAVHGARGHHANSRAVAPHRKRHLELAPGVGFSECVVAGL